jgi:4-amino-4-deoxy-L-arabinose transferase-like glycosyltransferase
MTGHKPVWTVLAASLLVVMALQLISLSRATSSTWDEPHHLFDGYTIWKQHDYVLNPEVPPLLKLTAALPLLHRTLIVPPLKERATPTEAFLDGRAFVFSNGGDRILFPARMACMAFTLALGLVLFVWTRQMFGAPAGIFALGLFVFDPNFLAHGALVTTDVGCACLFLATVYGWYRYCKQPHWGRLILVGICAGLALAVKFTGILVLPTLLLLVVCEAALQRNGKLVWRRAIALVLIAVIAFTALWSFYGFRYAGRPGGRELKPPLAVYLTWLPNPKDARNLSFIAHYHLLPEAYIWGLANTKLTENADTSYFFGHVYRHGNWKYFPAAVLIKSTLPFLILVVLIPVACLYGLRRRPVELRFLTLPILVYLAVAMLSDMNIGMRHILPIYPFLYALSAGAAAALIRHSRLWTPLFAVLLIWQIVTSVRVAPAYMAYANEAWGGPSQVHRYLSDANSDWGQQLKAAKVYLDQRNITNCWFAYFPDSAIEPSDYGIHCKRLPTTDALWWLKLPMDVPPVIDGTVLISDSDLEGIEFGQGALNPYESFRRRQPSAVIQDGLFVYDGRFDVSLASALVQAQKAENLLAASHAQASISEAKADAQTAVQLAPQAVTTQLALGDVLSAEGNKSDAHSHYLQAVKNAKTIEPELQADLIPGIEKKIASSADTK